MKHIVIVGAGVSGLATAYHLTRQARDCRMDLRVTVLESDTRPGGRVWTERSDGFLLETGANGFLDSKPSTLELSKALGLGDELIAARPEAKNRYILKRGRLEKIPTGLGSLLTTPLLSWAGKLRVLGEPLVRAERDAADETVRDFAMRRLGREAADTLIDAMVTGIYAGDAGLLSAPATFPRMVALEREHGSLLRGFRRAARARRSHSGDDPPHAGRPLGSLWSLRRGMGQLIERLGERCGGDVVTGTEVRGIRPRRAGGWSIERAQARSEPADAVVLACPSFAQGAITAALDPELSCLLCGIPYTSVVVVSLGFRAGDVPRPLDGFGYLSPQRTRRDVLGVLWCSSIFPGRAPQGSVLLRAMCGGWNRPDIAGWDADRVVAAVRDELRSVLGIEAPPILTRLIVWPLAIPQYHTGHLERVAAIEERRRRHPGLYLTGNSFRGVSVNDCTEEAERCAHEVIGELVSPHSSNGR